MRIASLFSGCGGFDLGFKQAGHNIVFAVDNDFVSCQTYKANIADIICADITTINRLPECDIIIGGPPCQGFSIASRRRKEKADGRNNMILEFARIVKNARPRFFIMENVMGLLHQQYALTLQAFLKNMIDAGYETAIKKLDVANYGVPQHRNRIFIYGGLDYIPSSPEPTHEPPIQTPCFPGFKPLRAHITANEALGWGETRILSQNRSTLKMQNAGKGYFYTSDRPARTITTGGHAICYPPPFRLMTVHESAKLQSFPDDFKFKGLFSQQRRQIGNAVPPLLARRIAEALEV